MNSKARKRKERPEKARKGRLHPWRPKPLEAVALAFWPFSRTKIILTSSALFEQRPPLALRPSHQRNFELNRPNIADNSCLNIDQTSPTKQLTKRRPKRRLQHFSWDGRDCTFILLPQCRPKNKQFRWPFIDHLERFIDIFNNYKLHYKHQLGQWRWCLQKQLRGL